MKGLFLSAVLTFLPVAAFAQGVNELAAEVQSFEGSVSKLEKRYLKPAMLASRYKLEARYNDARVAYFMQDYSRASVLLVDVVRNEKFKGLQSYREALFLLGDSLFQMRNYVAARRYFEQVFEAGPGSFYEQAAGRLLEIAYLTKNFDRLDDLYARLQGGNMGAAISYLSGKAFYEQKNYAKARENFARAATNPEYALTAEYFRGVTYAAEGKIAEAKQVFEAIPRGTTPTNAREYEIVDLAWLALGRLAYEDGDIEHAIDYYNRVPKGSPHYDRMLWELTWVLVSRGNYQEARRNVDIIQFLEDPDPDIAAQSQLLRADLSLKLDEYDAARADYAAVLDKFTPAAEQMNAFVAKHEDLPTFFNVMVEESMAGVDSNVLPPLVDEWIQNDPDMRAASQMLSDVQVMDRQIRDSYRMLDEISARLNSSTRVQTFPELAEGMSHGIAAEARLIEIRQKLLAAQYDIVGGSMSDADKARWAQMLEELAAIQEKFDAMPATRQQVQERSTMVFDELDRLRRRVDQIGYELDAQRAQLSAVDNYLQNDYGQPLNTKQRKDVEDARARLRQTIDELTKTKEALEHELNLNRQLMGSGDSVMHAERQLRLEYRAKLDAARDFLNSFGGSDARLQTIANARAKMPALEQRLDSYFAKMDELVGEKVDELQQDIAVERELIDDHRRSMQELVSASQSGAGVLAYLNFMKAQHEFNEIVLRGDVGLIDVAWEQKEDLSTKISDLFEERTSELRLLQEAFEEVR